MKKSGMRATALAAALLTMLAAPVAAPTASAVGIEDPMYGAPTVGECKNYTAEQGAAENETSAPVDCATTHTAKVAAVQLLPDWLDWDSSQDALSRYSGKTCFVAEQETLGRTDKLRTMSAHLSYFFWPTEEQRANGARWIRCDVVLAGKSKLLPLPFDTEPLLPAAPLPKSVLACRAGDNLILTACSQGHRWRATGAFRMGTDDYPGRTKFIRAANKKCPDLTFTSRWYVFWPSKLAWKLNNRTLVCYSKTTN